MGQIIFFSICGILFILACLIGVIALYLALKNWAWEEMDIELPPKSKPQESYWEFFEDSVVPTYICKKCRFRSDRRFCYCPNCGKFMKNHEE